MPPSEAKRSPAFIQRSAWKENSANFASTECLEVRIQHGAQLAPSSHPRLLSSEADAPLLTAGHKNERTDLSEPSRAARLVINVATLVAPSRCSGTLCATRHLHWSQDM